MHNDECAMFSNHSLRIHHYALLLPFRWHLWRVRALLGGAPPR